MNAISKTSLGLIAGLFALGIATAGNDDSMGSGQNHPMGSDSGNMPRGHHMNMDPVARTQQNLSELKAKLNLTKEQEPAMQTFSDQVKQQAKSMMAMQDKMKTARSKPAPEHMAVMADAAKDRAQAMSTMAESVKTFYGVLNPEQQATFDKIHVGHMSQMTDMRE